MRTGRVGIIRPSVCGVVPEYTKHLFDDER